MLPIVKDPMRLSVAVAGGAGKQSRWPPTFGNGSRQTRRLIALRRG
jgi:hypothetical protein